MPDLDELKAALLALVRGGASEPQRLLVRDAVESGQIALATGERAAAVGGDADGATIVTGDGASVVSFGVAEADAVRAAFAQLFPSRPYQLPPDLPDFTGREREVAELCEALAGDGGRAAISAIGGMGGIGKTTLAVHVARQLAARYPDGQLFIELRGTSHDPLAPAQAMAELIRALAPAARVPDDPRDVERLYRGTLEGRRVLILLDNAAGSPQVRPLLPSPPCAAVVTSRRAIVLPGLHKIDLDVMGKGESRDLLRAILADRRPGDAELNAIAGACGRLALALRVAGTFLARYTDWTVPEYVAALADERARLKYLRIEDDPQLDVAAALELSAAQLAREKPELAVRWEMLTAFPTSFDRAAAAAVWDVPLDEARNGLSSLFERTMLLFDADRVRYSLHDLMRDVARSRSSQKGQANLEEHLEIARARHATYYLQVLGECDHRYKGKGGAVGALALYDLEQRNIHAGQASAVAYMDKSNDALGLALKYSSSPKSVLDVRLHPNELKVWSRAQLRAARKLRDNKEIATALGNVGLAYARLGKQPRAIKCQQLRLKISCEIVDPEGQSIALRDLGTIWYQMNDLPKALSCHRQSLNLARKIGDQHTENTALGNLGDVYLALSDPIQACNCYKQRIRLARKIDDLRGVCNALGGLGRVLTDLHRPLQAITWFHRQLEAARKLGFSRGEANAQYWWGLALDQLHARPEAIPRIETALSIFEEINDSRVDELRKLLAKWRQETPAAGKRGGRLSELQSAARSAGRTDAAAPDRP